MSTERAALAQALGAMEEQLGYILAVENAAWMIPALQEAQRLLRAEESEGERAIREMADRHAGRWSDQPDGYWLQRLMQEVGELASVLAGDHDDTVEHELAQIGSIARNWLRRRGDGIAPSAPPTADLNLVHQIAALDPETATRDEESQCFFCHAYWQGWQECRSTDPTSHAEDCLWVRARALAALRSTEPGGAK